MAKLAVLDIGTNSIHMVLAEVEPDFSYKILDRFKDMTRLGDGAFATHRLSEAAMTRALDVIRRLVTLARHKGFDRIKAVATSAVREAVNGGEFIDTIARQTGLRVRVVTGQEEARLIYLGVRHSMDFAERPALVVDVGGGSVELIVGNRTAMIEAQSLKLGAIRLKDLHLAQDPPTKTMVRELEAAVESHLKAALAKFRTKKFERIVASSGMAGNLAEIVHLQRTARPLPQLNLAWIARKELETVERFLAGTRFRDRLALPGLDPKRVDTLLPAAVILRVLMERTGHAKLTLSDKAIREGLLYDFVARHRERIKAEGQIPDVRRRNVVFLARRCHSPESHIRHVAALATDLFDQTKALHGLGPREREWLEFAALLHDIGYVINARQHHKHAYYLIKHTEPAGLTAEEIHIIASIARYHRRALPRQDHEPMQGVDKPTRHVIMQLSALLRIADGLDRSHFSVIQGLRIKRGNPLVIQALTSGDPHLELWAARSRSNLFEKVFGRRVEFQAVRTEEKRT